MLAPKVFLSLTLLGLCAHGVLSFPEGSTLPPQAENAIVIQDPASSETTDSSPAPEKECQPAISKPRGTCYVAEADVAGLSAQVSMWSKVLTIAAAEDEQDLETSAGEDKYQVHKTELTDMTFCSEHRIEELEQDLASHLQNAWKLSTSLNDATDAEITQYEEERTELIERLSELQVYRMRSSAMLTSKTFEDQVLILDANLGNILLLFPKSISRSLRLMLESGKSNSELADLAQQHPEAMVVALPQLMTIKYAGNLRNFNTAFQFAKSLPSEELNVRAYVTLYEQMRNNSQLETWESTKLAIQLYQTPSLPASASQDVQAQLTHLTQELKPLMTYFSNKTQACSITNVAYSTRLFTTGSSWPEYAAVYSSSTNDNKLWFHPQAGRMTFEIHSGSSLLYSTSGNTVDTNRRYVLEANEMFNVPPGAWKEWKLVPVNGGENFKILNAQNNEVLYVDSSSTVGSGFQRVLLKKPEATVSMRTNADLWSLKCVTYD